MIIYNDLRIDAPYELYNKIDAILGVNSNFPISSGWGYRFVEKEDDPYIPYITCFLSILAGKYDQLEAIGITRDSITIWNLYGYDDQCNMEFSPEDMYNLGKEGITLCVTCWEDD